MEIFVRNLIRYFLAICATTVAGVFIGGFIGGISFVCAGGYNILFDIDQGFPFGMICGFVWGVLFGWIVLMRGYFHSSLAAMFTVVFALPPALLGSPGFAWLAGIFGSLFAVPVILVIERK